MIFGFGEVFAMVISQYLMNNLMDLTAFTIAYICGLVSYLILIIFPDSIMLTYLANVLLLTGIGGWINIQLLILELRVPPKNLGSISALIRTISVGSGVISPTIANLAAPWPYICLAVISFFAFVLIYFLPPPGMHLLAVEKTNDTSVVILDKHSNAPTLSNYFFNDITNQVSITNYALHQSSFIETFTERYHNVSRP